MEPLYMRLAIGGEQCRPTLWLHEDVLTITASEPWQLGVLDEASSIYPHFGQMRGRVPRAGSGKEGSCKNFASAAASRRA